MKKRMVSRTKARPTATSGTFRTSTILLGAELLLGLVLLRDGASPTTTAAAPDEFRREGESTWQARRFVRDRHVRHHRPAHPARRDEEGDGGSSDSASSKSAARAKEPSSVAAVQVEDVAANSSNHTINGSDAKYRTSGATLAPAPAHLLHNQTYSNWSLLLSEIPVSPSRFLNAMPTGLRLAFVGDSISRYQSLSLMYHLHTGDWFSDETRPSLVAKTDDGYASWVDYFASTGQRLGQDSGHHWCDCFRNDSTDDPHSVFENRYFREPDQDNYVYLITKLGWSPARGRWWPSRIGDWREPRSFDGEDGEAKWTYQWGDLIGRHLARLDPRPTVVLFNEGLWQGIGNASYVEIRQALRDANMTGLYRTTSKRADEKTPDLPGYDAVGCSMFPCLDVSWTYVLALKPYYCDYGTHFTSMVYTLFNQQLLKLLEDLTTTTGEH